MHLVTNLGVQDGKISKKVNILIISIFVYLISDDKYLLLKIVRGYKKTNHTFNFNHLQLLLRIS